MALITEAILNTYHSDQTVRLAEQKRLRTKSVSERGVFLSHSHKDRHLVLRVVSMFEQLGIAVYIDWLDQGLPENTEAQTARILKEKIKARDRFVVLGTPNGLESQWVPWELGYADGVKVNQHIAILPVNARGSHWVGREYMGVYSSIELEGGEPRVVSASSSIPLIQWLK